MLVFDLNNDAVHALGKLEVTNAPGVAIQFTGKDEVHQVIANGKYHFITLAKKLGRESDPLNIHACMTARRRNSSAVPWPWNDGGVRETSVHRATAQLHKAHLFVVPYCIREGKEREDRGKKARWELLCFNLVCTIWFCYISAASLKLIEITWSCFLFSPGRIRCLKNLIRAVLFLGR
jgi:hypothetical protein